VPPLVPPPQVVPGGQRRRDDADCIVLTSRSFQSLPRSASGPQAGPRRRAPWPTTRRDASACLHHHRHHHRSCHHHYHHVWVISPRGSSSNNYNSNSSSSNKHSSGNSNIRGRPASRVAGRSRAPSKCNPFFSMSLVIMPMGLNPSFVFQGFLPFFSQCRTSSTRYQARRWVWFLALGVC
jgi:hypothetical protein